jgi:hypothetical protein
MFLEVDRVEGLWSTKKSQFGERFCPKRIVFLTHHAHTHVVYPLDPPKFPSSAVPATWPVCPRVVPLLSRIPDTTQSWWTRPMKACCSHRQLVESPSPPGSSAWSRTRKMLMHSLSSLPFILSSLSLYFPRRSITRKVRRRMSPSFFSTTEPLMEHKSLSSFPPSHAQTVTQLPSTTP